MEECELCHRWAYLEVHHVYNGPYRKHSDKWGMIARLCPICHRTGKNSVHLNYDVAIQLKQRYQEKFELNHTREEFRSIFGRSYL